MSLTQMTLSGGVFILFIAVVRALALHHLPKTAFLALWEMAALRLLLPFYFPSAFSVSALMERLLWGGKSMPPVFVPGAAAVAAVPVPANGSAHVVLQGVWLGGMALMAAYFALLCLRGGRKFRLSLPDETPAVQDWLAGHRLCRPLEVRQSDQVSSPLTYGVFRPVILLPKNMERGDRAALTYILTHELVHIRRFDAVTKMVFAAALCVHWFNPLAWVMYLLANRDLELSCDERVMDTLGGREKAPYALTLINMEETRSRGLSLYNHFGKLAIEERIEAIMKYKKASVLAAALAAVLVVGATTAFASSADSAERDDTPAGEIGMKFYDYQIVENDSAVSGALQGEVTYDPEFPMVRVYKEEGGDAPAAAAEEKWEYVNLEDFEAVEMGTLIAVRPEDESKFTPEEWADILEKIDRGEIRWQDWD